MNFFPFVALHYAGEPFAVRLKNISRFENREIITIDDGKPTSERVDESFEEIADRIREACSLSMNDVVSELYGK